MIIAHDLGTTGNKATLVDPARGPLASETVAYPADFGPSGKAEQDPDAWWQAVCTASSRLLERTGTAASEIDVISFSGQMMGAVLLDRRGRPVRPAIIWADTRSTAACDALIRQVGMESAYRTTGHRLNPTYSLTKIMWVREHEPEAFERTVSVVQAKDYIAFRLTGELATDPSDASSTNAYDQATGRWSEELITASGLPPSLFPTVIDSTSVIGAVTPEAASVTGLRAGTPVVLGGGDGPMAALGAGIVDPEDGGYCYLGSSSWVSLAAPAPLHDPQMRTMTFNHVLPGRFVPTATMQAGGASLEWIVDTLAPDDPEDGYRELLASAARASASADGLYFLPHLLGERSPYWNPAARAVFAGLAKHHGRANLTRAVLEGVAFNLRSGLRAFAESGTVIDEVLAIGGAARSEALLQIFADVWGVPVIGSRLADEATSLGAAVVGGLGIGLFDDPHIARRWSATTATARPDRTAQQGYARAYEVFLDAYRRLEPWFDLAGQPFTAPDASPET